MSTMELCGINSLFHISLEINKHQNLSTLSTILRFYDHIIFHGTFDGCCQISLLFIFLYSMQQSLCEPYAEEGIKPYWQCLCSSSAFWWNIKGFSAYLSFVCVSILKLLHGKSERILLCLKMQQYTLKLWSSMLCFHMYRPPNAIVSFQLNDFNIVMTKFILLL